MKKLTILLLILVLSLSVVLTGCSPAPVHPSIYDSPVYATDAVTGGELMLVKNHESDYVIVIGQNAHAIEIDAASELQYFVKESTGATLNIVRDNEVTVTNNDKVVLLGDTIYSEDLVCEFDELGDSGFKMNLRGNNVIIKGATPEGTLYSAYELLSKVLHFEQYAIDEYYIDRLANVKMVKIENVTDIPAIDYRNAGWYMSSDPMAKRMRLIDPVMTGTSVYGKDWASGSHSLRNTYIPYGSIYENQELYPGLINSNGHFCFSKDGLIEPVATKVVSLMINQPTARLFVFGNPDDSASCSCYDCKANLQKYGTVAGILMVWTNKVANLVEQKMVEAGLDREITIYVDAYNAYQGAPATMHEDGTITASHPDVMGKTSGKVKVGVRYAPISACYAHPLNDPNCKINSAGRFADELKKWRYIVGENKLHFYGYVAEFYDYMMIFNDFGMMNGSYKFFGEVDLYGIFDSAVAQYNVNGPMMALKDRKSVV